MFLECSSRRALCCVATVAATGLWLISAFLELEARYRVCGLLARNGFRELQLGCNAFASLRSGIQLPAFRGLRVRMGIHSGVAEQVSTHSVTRRCTYGGKVTLATTSACLVKRSAHI
eukprot:3923517-Pyramimonas_sp.AAC.2